MSERNGKKQTWTLGQQKRGELKRQGDQRREAKRGKKKQKPTQLGEGLQFGFITSKQGNWVVRWGGGAGSLPPFFRLYLPSSTQNRHFISFFLQKVVAALQEPVVLVGKKFPIRCY